MSGLTRLSPRGLSGGGDLFRGRKRDAARKDFTSCVPFSASSCFRPSGHGSGSMNSPLVLPLILSLFDPANRAKYQSRPDDPFRSSVDTPQRLVNGRTPDGPTTPRAQPNQDWSGSAAVRGRTSNGVRSSR